MRLDPVEHKLRALLQNLHNRTQIKTSTLLRGTGEENTHIAKRPCTLHVPIAGCRYALKGHDLTFAHASHDQAQHRALSCLAVTVLTVMLRYHDLFKLIRTNDWIVTRVAIFDTLDRSAFGVQHST